MQVPQVFNVKEGWAPLAKFLGVPAPSKPFPRANDRASMAKEVDHVRNVGWGIVVGGPVVMAAMIYGAGSLLASYVF